MDPHKDPKTYIQEGPHTLSDIMQIPFLNIVESYNYSLPSLCGRARLIMCEICFNPYTDASARDYINIIKPKKNNEICNECYGKYQVEYTPAGIATKKIYFKYPPQ